MNDCAQWLKLARTGLYDEPEIHRVCVALEAAAKEVDRLQRDLASLRSVNETLEVMQKHSTPNGLVESLRRERDAARAEAASLGEEMARRESKYGMARETIYRRDREVDELKATADRLEALTVALAEALRSVQSLPDFDVLTAKGRDIINSALSAEGVDRLMRELAALREERDELAACFKNTRQAVGSLAAELAESKALTVALAEACRSAIDQTNSHAMRQILRDALATEGPQVDRLMRERGKT